MERESGNVTGRTEGQPGKGVLVIRPGALGDTILALPAVRALREWVGPAFAQGFERQTPQAGLELVGYPRNMALAINPLHAGAGHSIDRALFSRLFSRETSPELRDFLGRYSHVVAWSRDNSGGLRALLESSALPHVLATPFPAPDAGVHATDHLLHSLEIWGIAGACPTPKLVVPEAALAAASVFLESVGFRPGEFLGIHPGSGSSLKNWPAQEFVGVAERAHREGIPVLVVEGEADANSVEGVLARLSFRPALASHLGVLVLAAVLARAGAYVGCDSGVSHLAAAAGAPTVVLFGSTDPRTWAPRGAFVRVRSASLRAADVWPELAAHF